MGLTTTLTSSTRFNPTVAKRLQAALEHARRLTVLYGTDHRDVVIAWDAVEELTTAYHRQSVPSTSAFSRYCAAHPDAPECRVYED